MPILFVLDDEGCLWRMRQTGNQCQHIFPNNVRVKLHQCEEAGMKCCFDKVVPKVTEEGRKVYTRKLLLGITKEKSSDKKKRKRHRRRGFFG